MLTVRPADARGVTNIGWLNSRHTFSFADYVDPAHHHYRGLRVINDDHIAPSAGFGAHPHRDMEILTYVLRGAIEHKDSMGNGEVLRAGELQAMTAGRGIVHSEFNPSDTEPTHLLQIWLPPAKKGLNPAYAQRGFPPEELQGRWRLVASPDAADGSLLINTDARLFVARLAPGETATHAATPGRGLWLHVATGAVTANGQPLEAGDAVAVEGEPQLTVTGTADAEVLLFDLA